MKPTKHAYVKVRQNRPENDHENTTITPYDHEDANEPNSIPVTLPYPLEYHASANNMNESDILEHRPTAEPSDPIGFIKTHRNILSKTSDSRTPKKPTTANPKPADGIPPVSYHPHRETLIRPDTTQHRINEQPENNTEHHRRILKTYKNNPNPPSCHNYGQHFKHASQNQPAHKHQNNQTDIPRTLKPKTKTQPTFDPTEINQ